MKQLALSVLFAVSTLCGVAEAQIDAKTVIRIATEIKKYVKAYSDIDMTLTYGKALTDAARRAEAQPPPIPRNSKRIVDAVAHVGRITSLIDGIKMPQSDTRLPVFSGDAIFGKNPTLRRRDMASASQWALRVLSGRAEMANVRSNSRS